MILMTEFCLLLGLLASTVYAQAPQDPLKDFCRRYGHQTTVIDRKLYIDGGWLYANPIDQNPVPTINQGLLYSDLDQTSDGMPTQYANLSKNSTIPDVAGGILWPDEVNKVFWLYGGEYSILAPASFQLWGYDTLLNQWNMSSASSTSATFINRVSYGAGSAIGGKGYYYGGYLNNMTSPRWDAPPLATSNLVIFDMDANTLSNSTGADSIGRAEGVMVSIPASAGGMLVYFGGVSFPYGNTTEVAMEMTNIMLYDIADSKWYTQTATGNVPGNRRKFCAGATWADDQSSYNIYLYGGFGFGENSTGFDDVYILSLPTFEWIKWYPDAPGASAPHGLLTCNVIDNAQMIVMGGNFTNSTACDVPSLGAQHNLNLQNKWLQYMPNLTDYAVPSAILSVTGGSSNGGASNLSPVSGWSDPALSVYFGQKARFDQRTPTRYIPLATQTSDSGGSKPNIGAIAGGAVGGVVVLVIVAVTVWWCLRKRKSKATKQPDGQPPAQPRMSNVGELTGEPQYEPNPSKLAVVTSMPGSPGYANNQPHSPPYTTPPPFQPGHPMAYQQPQHDPQQYYQMQQQGYVYPQYHPGAGSPPTMYPQQLHGSSPPPATYPHPHSTGSSSPPVMYSHQQQYFPPPEINRMSPQMPHEMPTARTPGVHHVHQPIPQRPEIMESISSRSQQEKSQRDSFSYTHSRTMS